MLKNSYDRSTLKKQISVCTESDAFTQVLEQLLVCWGYCLCRPAANPDVLNVVEEGCVRPLHGENTLRLHASGENGPNRLVLPLDLELLWQALERHFHSPQRLHMRRAVNLPARALLRGAWQYTRLSSLSDMGARFLSDRELIREEPVTLDFLVDGVPRQYEGRVIFSMAEKSGEVHSFQSGVVFYGQDKTARDELRNCLIREYFQVVRAEVPRQTFQDGLAFFALVPELRDSLLSSQ